MRKIQYRFSPNISAKKIIFIKFIDRILYFFSGNKHKSPVKITAIDEITITQLAHIGDLILLLPALKKLKSITSYKIKLIVSSQNYPIASRLTFIDSVQIADAPYFTRNKKVSYLNYIKQLLKIKTGLLYDIRGDMRNIFFLKIFAHKKILAGFNVGGAGALLDVILPYKHQEHTTTRIDPLFEFLQLPVDNLSTYWHPDEIPYDCINDPINFPDNFIVIHLGTGAPARKWPIGYFIDTIIEMAKTTSVFVMGTYSDISQEHLETLNTTSNITVCVGKYTILQSIYILKKCTLFLGLDSGFSHIAALLGKKAIILFSGAADKNVWVPYQLYDGQITFVEQQVPCNMINGCGKIKCDENICMKLISPLKVVDLLKPNLISD